MPIKKSTTAKKSTKSKPKTEKAKPAPKKNELLAYNPLIPQSQQNLPITVGQETEQKVEIINEIESLAEIKKQQLSIRRQRVELEVENKKLDVAKQTISTIDKIIYAVSTEEVLKRVTQNIQTPLDMKLMAEAAEKLSNTLKQLMNPNVMDEMGTKKRTKINFMFRSTGVVQGALQVDTSDD
ncbi:MAG: hypothetical protein WC373_05635 [Smithella sp.]|jgi:hypothetical protein